MSYPPFRALGNYYCIFGNDPFGPANPDYDPIVGYAPMGIPFAAWSVGSYVSPTQLTCLSPPFFNTNGPVDVVIVDQNPTGLASSGGHLLNVVFYQAAAWTWLQPTLVSITPATGPGRGDDAFTVTGSNFYPGATAFVPNWIVFGTQEVPVTYVNATTLTGRTPGVYKCTPLAVDVTLLPPLLPAPSNSQYVIRQPSSTLPGGYTYGSVWWTNSGESPWSFTTCDTRISSDWEDFLEWFLTEFGYPWDNQVPPGWTFKFVEDLPPFEWFWYGPWPPGWNWPPYTGPPPDPNGWYTSVSGFRGDIFVVAGGRPEDPRSWTDFAGFATGTAAMLGGSPGIAASYRNRLIYAASGYVVGTDAPPLRIFDGSYDRDLTTIPPTAAGEAKAIVSLLTANGTIYVSTWDAGTDSTTFTGRVFSLDIESAALTPIGAAFPTGHVPYALAWHNGMLWCGTHRQAATAAGKVYRIRPDIEQTWTEDYTLATVSMAGVAALYSFHGTLYVGTTAPAASFAVVLARDSAGAYTIVDTGSGGAAHANNGYLALVAFQDALYAAYWNGDTPAVARLRKTVDDGVTWTTSYTGAAATIRPFIQLTVDDATLFALGGGLGLTLALVSTEDGVTWTNLTPQLPETDKTALPAMGVVVL